MHKKLVKSLMLIFSLLCKFNLIQFLMVLPSLVENFEARMEIYASKLIKKPYNTYSEKSESKFNFYCHIRHCVMREKVLLLYMSDKYGVEGST